MDGDVNYFWCHEQYQFKSEILEEKGCIYSVYSWSEEYLHWKGPVRLVHEVADRCLYKERTFAHHNGFFWYLLKVVVIPVALTAVCVRAMGRYFLIAQVEVKKDLKDTTAKTVEDFKANDRLNATKLLEHMEFNQQFLKNQQGKLKPEELDALFTMANGVGFNYKYLHLEDMQHYLEEYDAPGYQTVDGFLWGAHESSGFINASDEELNSVSLHLLNKKSYKNLLKLLGSYPYKCSVSPETLLKMLKDPTISTKVIQRLDHLDLLHLFEKKASLELIQMTVDKDYDVYLFYAYEFGLDKEVINYLKSKLDGDLLDRWLNGKMKLHEEHLKELVEGNWIDQNGLKLNKEPFRTLFKTGKVQLGRSQELDKRLVQWCADLDPAIQEYIKQKQLYAESESFVQSFKVGLQVRPDKGTMEIGTNDFVVTDVAQLPEEWKKFIAPAKEIGRGTFSICTLTRRIRRVGNVWKVSSVVKKEVDTSSKRYYMDAVREANFLKEVFGKITDFTYLEKKLKVLDFMSIGKFYKSGDASAIRPPRSDNPKELKFRAKILIDACLGAKELMDKYQLYQTDFKVQNIFYRVKGGVPKAVCGDFGILTKPEKGGIKYGTFEKEAEIAGDAKYQESRVTYQVWVAAKFLFRGTRDPKTLILLESLRQSQTLESSLKILQNY